MFVIVAGVLCASAAWVPAPAVAQTPDYWELSHSWRFGAGVYGYFPDVRIKQTFPDDVSSDINIAFSKILEHLMMGFAGAAEVQKGRWGAFTDVL